MTFLAPDSILLFVIPRKLIPRILLVLLLVHISSFCFLVHGVQVANAQYHLEVVRHFTPSGVQQKKKNVAGNKLPAATRALTRANRPSRRLEDYASSISDFSSGSG